MPRRRGGGGSAGTSRFRRNAAHKIGVLIFGLWLLPLLAQAAPPTFPALTGRVIDDAHLLSPASVEQLTDALAAEEQRNGDQVVVVTVPSLQGQEIEDYGYRLGRAWGIGQKGRNNGAIVIVAPTERRTRIEVGYGLEGTLTDAVTSTIVNTIMLPAFKAGQYDQGIVQGTDAVLNVLQGGEPPAASAQTAPHDQNSKFPALLLIGLVILLLCFPGGRSFLTTMLIFSSFGGGRGGGSDGGGFGGGGGSFGGGGASGRW